ncbi:hypothetical protein QJS10_CPA08g00304 [Acorus calamus]|uniref:Uncharacterized protein n=1 Tax=Acorus calamus TaxID=4465 RepID=A0AAV9E8B6_ACOCL|nr:hypothetical protein QJS10_CPA08g00304 [Acorus calamus]
MDEPYITHQSNPIYMEISGGANNRCSFKKAWGGFGAVKGTGEVGDVEIPAAYHGWPDTIIASSSCNASPTFVDGCCYVHSWFGSVRKNDEAISLDSTIWQETNTSNMLGQVTSPKQEGGLGLRRFATSRDAILECKYAAEVYLPKLPSTPTFMAKKQLEYIVSPSFVEE